MLLHHANTNGKKLNQNMKVTLKKLYFYNENNFRLCTKSKPTYTINVTKIVNYFIKLHDNYQLEIFSFY